MTMLALSDRPQLDEDELEQAELRAICRMAEMRVYATPAENPVHAVLEDVSVQLTPQPAEPLMSKEKRSCPVDGCSKNLRSDNKNGICAYHQARGHVLGEAAPARRAAKPKPNKEPEEPAAINHAEVTKRFIVVTEALGFKPNDILAELMESWLGGLRKRLERA